MAKSREAVIVEKIIKRYGPVIDLRKSPRTIIDIIRIFGLEPDDGGAPPGGTPPPPEPSPPPGPSDIQFGVTLEELMREVLKISREVGKIKQGLKLK